MLTLALQGLLREAQGLLVELPLLVQLVLPSAVTAAAQVGGHLQALRAVGSVLRAVGSVLRAVQWAVMLQPWSLLRAQAIALRGLQGWVGSFPVPVPGRATPLSFQQAT